MEALRVQSNTMTYYTRGTALFGVDALVTELGGDSAALMRARGIDPADTSDFERFLRYADAASVIGDAAQLLGLPDFGMQVARRQSLQILGPLGVIIRNAETVGDALDGVGRFLRNLASAETAQVIRTEQAVIYSFDTILDDDFDRYQMVELSLGIAMKALALLLGDSFVPLRVTFQHRQLAQADQYHEMFRRLPEFETERNAIYLPLRSLSQPIQNRDPAALTLAENYLTRTQPGLGIADHVREVARRLLPVNQANLLEVARAMTLHPRVLQRNLAEEGCTFEQILDDIRRNMAWSLSATGIQVSQIAQALGYSEQSSYSRACRRWYGESPRQLRARLRGQPLAR